MRTAISNAVTLQYPDEIGFAFNPCLLIASGENVNGMTVVVAGHTVTYEALGGKVYADIRAFIQSLFDTSAFGNIDYTEESNKSPLGLSVDITVTAGAGEFSFTTFYVWGALNYGETYNGYREVTYFQGMPFTLGFYNDGREGAVLFSNDGKATSLVRLDGEGVFDLPIPKPSANNVYHVYDFKGTLASTTFTDVFDLTFSKIGDGTYTLKATVNVQSVCGDGVYLRWIDRKGMYCYYYFEKGDESHETEASETFLRNNLLAWDMSYGYKGGAGRRQTYTREDTVTLCAPLANDATWAFLLDLLTSPVVDMLLSWDGETAEWVSVSVDGGTFTKNGTALQDFEFNIILPQPSIQTL